MSNAEITTKILEAWQSRAEGMGYRPHTVTYQKLRLEFLMGAFSAMIAAGHMTTYPPIMLLASVGRPTEDLFPKPQA